MEWKSSADKEKYDDMIGEVIHHTLFEDGTITKYDVKFGNKTIKNIPTEMLEVVKAQEHMHDATDDDDDEKEEILKPFVTDEKDDDDDKEESHCS